MKFLVTYVDFHPDNYQGGSGKSFQFKKLIEIPGDVRAAKIYEEISWTLTKLCMKERPFNPEHERNCPSIVSVELLA